MTPKLEIPDARIKSVVINQDRDEEGVYSQIVVTELNGTEYRFQFAQEKALFVGEPVKESGPPSVGPREFKRGDVVQLKSGGPSMTAQKVFRIEALPADSQIDPTASAVLCALLTEHGWKEIAVESDLLVHVS